MKQKRQPPPAAALDLVAQYRRDLAFDAEEERAEAASRKNRLTPSRVSDIYNALLCAETTMPDALARRCIRDERIKLHVSREARSRREITEEELGGVANEGARVLEMWKGHLSREGGET